MPFFRVKIGRLLFDEKPFKRNLNKELEVKLREGVRRFLRAIIKANLPPVLTGMARAILVPLAKKVGGVSIPINPKITRRDRTPAKGETAGQEGRGFRLDFDRANQKAVFRFSIQVLHYRINEALRRNYKFPPKGTAQARTPWRSLIVGRQAMRSYLRLAFSKRNLQTKPSEYFSTSLQPRFKYKGTVITPNVR